MISAARRISSGATPRPGVRAAAWVSPISSTVWSLPTLKIIAKRRSWGRTSRRNSIRLPARFVACSDSPVTLPPGLARFATRPLPTGSIPYRNNRCRLLYCGDGASDGDNDVDLEADKFGCDLGVALGAALGPAILDRDGTALDPAEFAQVCHKRRRPWTEGRSICAQEAD